MDKKIGLIAFDVFVQNRADSAFIRTGLLGDFLVF